MNWINYILFFFFPIVGISQSDVAPDPIDRLIEKYSEIIAVKCEVNINIDVEGMKIPDKQVLIEIDKDKPPKIIGKGLTLLPKKGLIGQFKELFDTPLQPIYLSKRGVNVVYKLVSLDSTSDWVTADIEFDGQSLLIFKVAITTRKHGTFYTEHKYDNGSLPSSSLISFDIEKFTIPLKFIGRSEDIHIVEDSKGENIKGKITLTYSYF
jgi:hypothetical protein